MSLDRENFLKANSFSEGDWEKSKCSWDLLCAIRVDFEQRMGDLAEVAEFHARMLQKLPKVHSVRWRVKDPVSLIAKIIRKAANGEQKYLSVNLENYTSLITDLVGVRALHLFKSDYSEIHKHIKNDWELTEPVLAYIRNGDRDSIKSAYEAVGMDVKVHPFGYRSIHYVARSQPKKSDIFAEFQLRTIFEEGWSEIDHRIKYPNQSDDQLIGFFLDIFNRAAGSADEMGDFAYDLSQRIAAHDLAIAAAAEERDGSLSKLDSSLEKLRAVTSENEEAAAIIKKLTAEVQALKKPPSGITFVDNDNLNSLRVMLNPTIASLAKPLSARSLYDVFPPDAERVDVGLGKFSAEVKNFGITIKPKRS